MRTAARTKSTAKIPLGVRVCFFDEELPDI